MTLKVYLIFLAVMSGLALILYVADKIKAIKMAWRIPEKVLLGLSFFGGAMGGYLAMNVVRHKTKKWYFHAVNLLGLAWQIALLVYLALNPNILF
jgi:uncharacterized membrane protein YsdA (DUF1294 family)